MACPDHLWAHPAQDNWVLSLLLPYRQCLYCPSSGLSRSSSSLSFLSQPGLVLLIAGQPGLTLASSWAHPDHSLVCPSCLSPTIQSSYCSLSDMFCSLPTGQGLSCMIQTGLVLLIAIRSWLILALAGAHPAHHPDCPVQHWPVRTCSAHPTACPDWHQPRLVLLIVRLILPETVRACSNHHPTCPAHYLALLEK